MRLSSVRVRLMLWNIGVLALILVGFAMAVQYTVRVINLRTIDRNLAGFADFMVERWANPPPFGPPFRGEGPPQGPPPPSTGNTATVDSGRSASPPTSGRNSSAAPAVSLPSPSGSAVSNTPPKTVAPNSGAAAPFGSDGRRGAGASGPPPFERRGGPPGRGPRDERRRRDPPRFLDVEGKPLYPWDTYTPLDPSAMRRSLKGERVYSFAVSEEIPMRVFSVPLARGKKIEGVVQVSHPLEEMHRLLQGVTRTLLFLIPLALLSAGIGGAFLTGRALRPVRDLSRAAEEIGAEDLSRRLPIAGGDEFAQLAGNFNRMFDRLQYAFRNLEDAIERQRRFTADASHELRTPLTTIKANTSLALMGKRTPEEYRQALESADRAAESMNRIVADLLLLARSDSGPMGLDKTIVAIEEAVRRAIADVPAVPPHVPIRLLSPSSSPLVQGEEAYLSRLFLNLLTNAIRHTTKGEVTVSIAEEGDRVVVRVADTGEGIAPEHLPHLGERFYRVDAARSRAQGGFGLGLAICKSIAHEHDGTIDIASEVGRGTVVAVALPRLEDDEEEMEMGAVPGSQEASPTAKGLIG